MTDRARGETANATAAESQNIAQVAAAGQHTGHIPRNAIVLSASCRVYCGADPQVRCWLSRDVRANQKDEHTRETALDRLFDPDIVADARGTRIHHHQPRLEVVS